MRRLFTKKEEMLTEADYISLATRRPALAQSFLEHYAKYPDKFKATWLNKARVAINSVRIKRDVEQTHLS